MNIEIAYAGAGDVDELVDLFEQYRSFYGKAPTSQVRTFLAERIEGGQTLVLLARDGVGVVGFAQVYRAFDSIRLMHEWVIADLFVDGAARGRRVGGALLEAVLDGARADGAHQVRVSTQSDNAYARRLYESRGFEQAGTDDAAIRGVATRNPAPPDAARRAAAGRGAVGARSGAVTYELTLRDHH